MTQVHQIEGTDNLLMQTIQDQAEDLEHGWREAIQNGIDSPEASRVALTWDERHTVVEDDGAGVDLTTEAGLDLLKNLGETSKKGDADTIGQFGVGKGQVIAKGHTVWMSGSTGLHFDVKEWGLTCKTVPLAEEVDGLRVVVSHYDEEVPTSNYKWDRYDERVRSRFKFVGVASDTEVVVNGDTISDADPADEVGGDYSVVEDSPQGADADFVAALEPRDGDIEVYSKGVYVKDVSGNGLSGVVVTRENLDLNFARNGIQSGCPVWGEVEPWLESKSEEVLSELPDSRLTAAGRSFLAERALDQGDGIDADAPMFQTVDGDQVSLNDINSAGKVGFAHRGDGRARKLAEGWNMTILDSSDEATGRLQSKMMELKEAMDMPEQFDVDQKADEVSLPDTHEKLLRGDLNSVQARKLAAARELAQRMGISRSVHWGDSEVSDAWTDGFNEIVLTDSAAPSRNRAAWLPQVFHALVRQWAFRGDSREQDMSRSTNVRYSERADQNYEALSELILGCERDGLRSAVSGSHESLVD